LNEKTFFSVLFAVPKEQSLRLYRDFNQYDGTDDIMDYPVHRVMEIFADIKGTSMSSDKMELDAEEFVEALLYNKEKQLWKAMEFLGITSEILYAALAYLLFLLMIIFAFIFLGIKAFAVGDSFSAVINSLLLALGAVSLGADEDKKDKVDHYNFDNVCKDSKILLDLTMIKIRR